MTELPEFSLIAALQRALAALPADPGTELGIGDDAALLQAEGRLAVAVDTLVEGVHFPIGTDSAALGWKSLAVNLSDLAAMGARPRWALLSLTLPQADRAFVEGFAQGWAALAGEHGVQLVGGDTTRGPLSISVTVLGQAPAQPLLRSGAAGGDELYLSGCCGEAAAGLALRQQRLVLDDAVSRGKLLARLERPQPRVALGQALAGIASAALDVSDGLLADLGHLLAASGGLGAVLDCADLPVSPALRLAATDAEQRRRWQLAGGDDYELLFSAAPAQRDAVIEAARCSQTAVSRIGRLTSTGDIDLRLGGQPLAPPSGGWRHF